MNSSWAAVPRPERNTVPVEMRFIDMFMAALGALIFMAMLLAFLLKYLPREPGVPPVAKKEQALKLQTRLLPVGRVGEPFEFAFAYRGGTGAVNWEIAAGAQDIPAAIHFDPATGTLSGVPTAVSTSRFVLRIRDGGSGADERPYELAFAPAAKSSRQIEKWLAISMLVIITIFWLITVGLVVQFRGVHNQLQASWNQGEHQVEMTTGIGTKEVIDLPEGIETYAARMRSTKQLSRYLFVVVLIFAAWLAWRLWKG